MTRRGLLLPKALYFGPKQGPGIFQAFADSVFGNLRGPDKEEFLSIFVDDCNVSTQGYGNETNEQVFDRHLRQLECFFKAAQARNIQFKFDKSKLGWNRIPMLGFVVGEGEEDSPTREGTGSTELARPEGVGRRLLLSSFCELPTRLHSEFFRTRPTSEECDEKG